MYRADLLGKWRRYLAETLGRRARHKHRYKHTLTTRAIKLISLIVIQLSNVQAILVRKAGKQKWK